MFSWRINALAFSGGEIVPLEGGSICLLIGPNSSGKSAALRNIQGLLQGATGPQLQVVQHATMSREGGLEEFQAWFAERYPIRSFSGVKHFVTTGAAVQEAELPGNWARGPLMAGLWQFLSTSLDTASRTTAANYTQAIDIWNQPPQAFVHALQTDDGLQDRVNSEIRAAFGRDLVIDWSATPQVGFRVGETPSRSSEHDRVSEQYATALQKLPRLDDDGDGIRSFAGCLLAAYCGSQPILMIDEPEAFLHPPQARRLGAALARAARENDRQVIIATHSAEIVQGALNTGAPVSVCRISRSEDKNHAALLDSKQLTTLWAKPLLRSAAAINGLFHVGVVVCEADADIRLYDTALRRAETKGLVAAPDLFFTQGGGKGELPTLANAYSTLATKCAIIADIDILRNAVEHHKCLAALGSSLDSDDPRYKSMLSALRDSDPILSIDAASEEIRAAVSEFVAAGEVTKKHKERISTALQQSSKFSEAKRYGITKLRGEPLVFANELLAEWRSVGLFILPVGELESWWPEGPANDKNAWIAGAVDLLQSDPGSLPQLEQFIADLVAYFAPA